MPRTRTEAPGAPPGQPGVLQTLRYRTFRQLWLASLVSNLGGITQLVGATWLMTTLTSSEIMVSLVQSSVALPIVLGAFIAGVLADNFDRRRIMMIAQIFMMAASIALLGLSLLGWLGPWSLLLFTFLVGCGTAMHTPSWQASLGDLVPRDSLPAAVAANGLGINLTRSVGPAIGGLLVAAFGPAASFVANACAYPAMIVALLAWKPGAPVETLPPERFLRALSSGIRYFLMSPKLVNVVTRSALFGFTAISIPALLPLVAKQHLSGGALLYGVLLGAFGCGAVVGALLAAWLRQRFSNEVLCRLGFAVYSACCVIIGLSSAMIPAVVASFAAGIFWLTVFAMNNSIVQLSTPRWVLARMLSLSLTGVYGGMAAGGWLWGVVAQSWSLQEALIAAAAVQVLGALWGFVFPLPAVGSENLEPLDAFKEPRLRLDLTGRSGPIVITVHYEILKENVPEFLKVMNERRRTRLRDNARNWSLLHDLENPNTWKEVYQFPTWVDYVRHNRRRTLADGEVNKHLASLHEGPLPFRVERLIERDTSEPTDHLPGPI